MIGVFIVVVIVTCVQAGPRILHGKEVHIQDFPYIASVHYDEKHIGAGVIITPRHLVTAAHLRAGRDWLTSYKVRVGSSIYNESGVVHLVQSFDTYDQPSKKISNGDIGLITLKIPIIYDWLTQPIAIVSKGEEPRHGEMLTTVGWGINEDYQDSLQLRMARMPSIDRNICNTVWDEALSIEFQIQDNMICAGGGMTSIFGGDSGGPLVNVKKQLVGIVSWGCGALRTAGFPSVFVNLAHHDMRSFIYSRLDVKSAQELSNGQ